MFEKCRYCVALILVSMLLCLTDGQTTQIAGKMDERMTEILQAAGKAPPLEIIKVQSKIMTLVDGPVQSWRGGNRLTTTDPSGRTILPGSYVASSLKVNGGSDNATEFEQAKDFVVDDMWGAFSITPGGRLRAGEKVLISYDYSLRRVDAVVRKASRDLLVITGTPSADCPLIPSSYYGVKLVAQIYRPFNVKACRPEDVYFVSNQLPDLSAKDPGPELAAVIRKLEAGDPVTVVCWGDSVTVGSDSGPPGSNYVSVFESRLRKRFPKAQLQVINAGIGGTSMPGRLSGIDKEVLAHKPDLVTLEFVNDMGVPIAALEDLYAKMLKKVHDSGAALIILTPHFTRPDWMPLPLGRGADPRPAVAFLKTFAKKNEVPLADASHRWEQLETLGIPYEIYLRNGINHPDERGHLIFAEELMRFFAPVCSQAH